MATLGYLQCRACTEALIEAFPTDVPNVPIVYGGTDAKSQARTVQAAIARELALMRTQRTALFLLDHLARHTDEFVRKRIIFSLSQAYGESIRLPVRVRARDEDMPAFDWIANEDPNFDSKLRARSQ